MKLILEKRSLDILESIQKWIEKQGSHVLFRIKPFCHEIEFLLPYTKGVLSLVMGRESWYPAVHGVAKSRTWLSDWTRVKGVQHQKIMMHLWESKQWFYDSRRIGCHHCSPTRRTSNSIPFSRGHKASWQGHKNMISIIGEFSREKKTFKKCKALAIPTGHLLEHCCCLVTKSYPTLCHLMDCSTPGFPVLHYLPEFAQAHVHWVSDAIQPSHPLSPPFPLALNLSQHQGLFPWVSSPQQVGKVLKLQLQHQPFQ